MTTPLEPRGDSKVNELDEILNGDELHMLIYKHLDEMLEHPNKHGIYPTTKFMVDLKKSLLTLKQRWERQARIDENQLYLSNIERWENRVPVAGEVTAASFGSAGAGMTEAAYKNAFEDRIKELEDSNDRL